MSAMIRSTLVLVVLVVATASSTAPILASGSGEGGGGMGEALITPHIGTIFWTLVTFICMLVILSRYAWKPMLGALELRENTIQENLDRAKNERTEAENLIQEHRQLVNDARRERAEASAKGREDAEKLKAEILTEAKGQRDQILEQTRSQVELSVRQAQSELQATAADLAIKAAEKLLARNLDDATQRKVVEDYLSQLERSSGDSSSLPS